MIAHQYKIRLQKEIEEKNETQFDISNIKLKDSYVKLISFEEAKKIVEEYEWLGRLGSFNKFYFGIFFKTNNGDVLGGVVVYSNEYILNRGVWEKYGFADKILLLSRGVCLWWTPKNTASFFIGKTLYWLRKNTNYKVITATVDPLAGEIGTIYQSLNWYYVGLLKGNYSKSGKELTRYSILINGKYRTSRSIRKELGSMSKDVVLKKYPNAQFIPKLRKRRYFYFIGTKNENSKYLNSIKGLIQPYPKRTDQEVAGLIYKITNTINNKIYIGQTIRGLYERINDYKNGLGNDYLNNAFLKYGFEKFSFEIIDKASSLDELNIKEVQWISKLKSNTKNIGYNLHPGGRNAIPSQETLLKISKAHKGIKQRIEWVQKRISKAGTSDAKKYGKTKTEEERKYLSENSPKYWFGKTRSEETKKKVSATKKAQGLLPPNIKKVAKIDALTNSIIETYISTAEAARKNPNISQGSISRKCNGKIKNNGPHIWKFI